MEYTRKDGLILMALEGADNGGGATLSGAIAFAEMLERQVPSAGEWSHALTCFLRAQILCVTGSRYVLSDDIRAQIKLSIGIEGLWAELPDKGQAVLKARRDVATTTREIIVTPEDVAEALAGIRKTRPDRGA
jgi:hypothetical protein